MVINDLLTILKARLSKFTLSIVDEDLTPHTNAYLRYDSVNKNWADLPLENIRIIDTNGIEVPFFPTDYLVTRADGYITFSTARAPTDVIRSDYFINPFSDTELTSILTSAVNQIRVLIFHPIDITNINTNYSEAIIKRAYTIALRELQFPTIRYFALSMGGRSIDKSQQVVMINSMIESNEKELLPEINSLRYFDKTNIIT